MASVTWPPPGARKILEGIVLGEAKTAGSKSVGVRYGKDGQPVRDKNGRVITFARDSSGEKGKAWRSDVRDAVLEAARREGLTGLIDGPIALETIFYRPRPKGHHGTGRNAGVIKDSAPAYPTTIPDAVKLLRAFEDALSKVLWTDDARITHHFTAKDYAERHFVSYAVYLLPATYLERQSAGAEAPPKLADAERSAGNSVIVSEQASLVPPPEEEPNEAEADRRDSEPTGPNPGGFPGL